MDPLPDIQSLGAPSRASEPVAHNDGLIAAYRGNPLAEAFGPIPDNEVWRRLLTRDGFMYDPSDRMLPAHQRAHAVGIALSSVRVATPAQIQVAAQIRTMQMQGYLHRNILSADYRVRLREDRANFDAGIMPPERFNGLHGLGAVLSGFAGTGKTSLAELVLGSVPQCIPHQIRTADGITVFTQATAVVIELFENADLKDLTLEFLNKLGASVGEPELARIYGVHLSSDYTAQPLIYSACRDYNVGLIVVDEVQNMTAHKEGYRRVLKYLVRLMNQCGVPTLVIGTPEVEALIQSDLSAGRRFAGLPRLEPFVKRSPLWLEFLATIWKYNYVRALADPMPVADLVHDLTGGIPDLVVKLYQLAQIRMFGRKDESVTEAVLAETAHDLFWSVRDRVDEIRGKKKPDSGISAVSRRLHEQFMAIINSAAAAVGAPPVHPEATREAPVEINTGSDTPEETNRGAHKPRRQTSLMDDGLSRNPREELAKHGILLEE